MTRPTGIVRGPKGHPIVGNALQIRNDPLGFLLKCAGTYDDIVRLRIFNTTGYVIIDPILIEDVLVRGSDRLVKTPGREPSGTSSRVFGSDRLTNDGDFWLRERPSAAHAFHAKRIEDYSTTMVEYTIRMLDRWGDGGERNIFDDMTDLTLRIVAKTLFGFDVGAEGASISRALDVIMGRITSQIFNPMQLPMSMPTPRNRRLQKAINTLDHFIDACLRNHQDGSPADLLSLLIDVRHENKSDMTDAQWRYEVMTLFIAGYETTALSLTWTFYLLARHPEVERRLLDELDEVLHGRPPEHGDIASLRYLGMVFKESLRLYPPVWIIGARRSLDSLRLGSHTLPKGSLIVVSPWVTHRMPRFFPEPDQFRPDRWTPASAKELPKYAYIPFSAGPRHCIGHGYASVESTLLIATILQRYRLALRRPDQVLPQAAVTLRPAGRLLMHVGTR